MVEKEYFFYLGFENSLCKDYITEKFFNAMKRNVVPVAMGGVVSEGSNDYKDFYKPPDHSFINVVKDYPNPADLAAYLRRLMANPSEYAEYFWWKEHYDITFQPKQEAFCNVCEKLHNPSEPRSVYEDFEGWWFKDAKCEPFPFST